MPDIRRDNVESGDGTHSGTAQDRHAATHDDRVGHDGSRDDRVHRDTREGTSRSGLGLDRDAQHREFGGFSLGAALFGWLVAIGLAALLTALLSAAGAAIGLTEGVDDSDAGTVSIVGGILLVLVLGLSYYAGGYVAGRLSRFDGARQGVGVWAIGLVVTLLLAAAGAIAGSEYNLLGDLDLPRIPIDEGSLATGGAITLAAVLLITLLAAAAGGKQGERFHRAVDAVGLHRDKV